MRSSLKQTAVGILRVSVSLAILYLIFYNVDVAATLERIAGLDWRALLAATVLLVVTMALHTKRWLIVLSSAGYSWKFRSAFGEMWIGYFFNQLLPSSVGGDGIRALRQYRFGVPAVTAVRAILTERVFGFIACTLLGIIAVPVMLSMAPVAPATVAVGITVAMGLVGILVLLHADSRLLGFLPRRFAYELRLVGDALRNRSSSAAAMAVSFAMQLCIAGTIGILSLGLGVDASPVVVALLFQPVTLITLVPITLAGWGVREGALVAVLSAVGVSGADALPLSLCFGAMLLLVSLPGWFFLAIGKAVGPQRDVPQNTGAASVV